MRTPAYCGLHPIVEKYFKIWQFDRNKDVYPCKGIKITKEDLQVDGIADGEVGVVDAVAFEPEDSIFADLMENNWDDDDYDGDQKDKKLEKTTLNELYLSAKEIHSEDYVHLKGIDFKDIPKRMTYHPRLYECPTNLKLIPELFVPWTLDFLRKTHEKYKRLYVAFTDGSVNFGCGGAGIFACPMAKYEGVDMNAIIEDKFDEIMLEPDMIVIAKAVGKRVTIDHAELDAIIHLLFILQQKITRNEVDLDALLVNVDSQVVLKWIYCINQVRSGVIARKIERLWKLISQLEVPVIFKWVKSHISHVGNELADTLAKLGMISVLKVYTWGVDFVSTAHEWHNVSLNALKGCHKVLIRKRMSRKWKSFKQKLTNKSLSYNFKLFDIVPSRIYKLERKHLSQLENRWLCCLRHGHSQLNAQRRFHQHIDTDKCSDCNDVETTEHFLLHCPKYNDLREDYQELLDAACDPSDSKLYDILFPFEDELVGLLRGDQGEFERLFAERIQRLKDLCSYVRDSDRFPMDGRYELYEALNT